MDFNMKENWKLQNKIETIGIWVVLLLCAFIPFRNPLMGLIGPAIKILPDIMIIALFVLYLISEGFKPTFYLHDWLFISFIGVGFVSSLIVNKLHLITFLIQIRSISIYYILYFVIRNFKYNRKEFIQIVRLLQFISVLLFILAIFEKVTNKGILFPTHIANSISYANNFTRVYSMFYNPNTYGIFIVFVIIMSISLNLIYDLNTHIYIYICLITSLFLTISRSAILILLINSMFILLFRIYKMRNKIKFRKLIMKFTVVLGIATLLYSMIIFSNKMYYDIVLKNHNENPSTIEGDDKLDESMNISIGDRFNELKTDTILEQSATNGRIYSIKKGLEIVKDYKLFGTGFGTYGSAASLNKEPTIYNKYNIEFPFYADNEYIKVLVESGGLGFIIFMFFITNLLRFYKEDFLKVVILVTILWFGLFVNILEIQIASILMWTYLSLNLDNNIV